jgi:Leucine-rich repeat (LRR) protein
VSHNIALAELDCFNNQLTSLDVSHNIALAELDCFNNQLTSLDVSQNAALTTLNCYYNQLTSLDVTHNTALTKLNCFSNLLTALDVSKNKLLTKLACKGNQLTTLDVSQNTELTELNCSDCQLTSLNVSGCTALTWLTCSGNKLTSLDVSDCKKLNYLYVELNRISMEAMDALIESLPKKNANESGGSFYALDSYNANFYGDLSYLPEMNFLTKEQVAAAKKKGWITYKNNKEYEGSEDLTGLLFTAKTKEGVDVIYQVTDAAEKLCQVGVERTNNRVFFAVEPQTTTLEIPEEVNGYKVTAIGADAFSNCEKLKNITMPNSVVSIGKNAFRQCYSLESIIIPSSVENIGSTAFCECNNLRSIYSEIVAPFDIAVSVFQGYDYDTWTFTNTPIYTEATLYVPEGSKEKYESAQGWNLFDKIVETGLGVVEEGQTIDFGTVINEGVDINGYLVDHIYICVSNSNGSYNAGDGCVVVTKATDDSAIDGKDIFGEDFKDGYTGIVFKVPSGEGTVKVDAATTGSMTLKVKIGSNEPIARTVEGRQTLSYPYIVSEDTYVYIYGGMNAVGAKGMKKAADEDALKIYGIEVTSGTDGIEDIKDVRLKMKDSPVYNLSGQRVISSPSGRSGGLPTKGIYIINGKKMVVK